MRILAVTSSVRPEMMDLCAWLMSKQTVAVDHVVNDPAAGKDRGRWGTLHHELVNAGDADYFTLVDDDDYIGPGFIEHCIKNIQDGYYGEIPNRTYHLPSRRYGETIPRLCKRQGLFSTFVVFERKWRTFVEGALASENPAGVLRPMLFRPGRKCSSELLIMRGVMKDPATAITLKKNVDGTRFPSHDPDLSVLRSWIGDEAVERYEACRSL